MKRFITTPIKFENDNLMEEYNIISPSELSFSKALYFFIIMG